MLDRILNLLFKHSAWYRRRTAFRAMSTRFPYSRRESKLPTRG